MTSYDKTYLEEAFQSSLSGSSPSFQQLLATIPDPVLSKPILPAHVGHQPLLVRVIPLQVTLGPEFWTAFWLLWTSSSQAGDTWWCWYSQVFSQFSCTSCCRENQLKGKWESVFITRSNPWIYRHSHSLREFRDPRTSHGQAQTLHKHWPLGIPWLAVS